MNAYPKWLSKSLLGLSAMFAIVFVIVLAIGKTAGAPHLLTGCSVGLALAASMGQGLLRQLNFTIWIATGVVVGMAFHGSFINFPSWFFGLGDRELTVLFIPVLQIIMFAMGTTLSVADFARVFKMPGGVLIGLACQFTIMPLVRLASPPGSCWWVPRRADWPQT